MSGCLIFLLSSLTVAGISVTKCKNGQFVFSFFDLTFYFNTEIARPCSHSHYLGQWWSSFPLRKVYKECSSYFSKQSGLLKRHIKCFNHRYVFTWQRNPSIFLKVSDQYIYVLGKVIPWRKLINNDLAFT